MSTAVDWALAEKVAVRVSGREPFAESYYYDSLEPDFAELTEQAEALVGQTTGSVFAEWPGAGSAHRPGGMDRRQHRVVPTSAPTLDRQVR